MVILLNGSINAGKSTIGQFIAGMNIGFAHIEVDALRHFIRWMPLEESIAINLENAASVAINFHRRHIDSVITIPLSRHDYEYLADRLSRAGIAWCSITLFPGVSELKKNRGNRVLTDWEFNRIDQLVKDGLAKPDFGTIIDNSEMSVEETAFKVLESAGYTMTMEPGQPVATE